MKQRKQIASPAAIVDDIDAPADSSFAGSAAPMTYRFEFQSSYQNEVDYLVHGDGAPYRVRWRVRYEDWERGYRNHYWTDADWQREVVSSVGLLRTYGSPRSIPAAVVDARSIPGRRTVIGGSYRTMARSCRRTVRFGNRQWSLVAHAGTPRRDGC